MISGPACCFDVHNDGYFLNLSLSNANGFILEMSVARMDYESFAEFFRRKKWKLLLRLDLYLDHLDMDLLEYLGQADATEMDACVSKTKVPPKKRVDLLSIHKKQTRVKRRLMKQRVLKLGLVLLIRAKIRLVKIKQKALKQGLLLLIMSMIDFDSDDDSDYDSNKSVGYLNPGEEELIELRNMMKANREKKAKGNLVPKMNEPNDRNYMPIDTTRSETMVGEKYVSVNLFKECLTYYALANGFSLWYKRCCRNKMVAKCGKRPPKLYGPGTGKQRKQNMWIGNVFGDKLKANPKIRLCDIADLEMKKYKSYGKAILDSNPGFTVKLKVTVNPDDKRYFDSPNQDEILTAIGRDVNNHLVAWAVVDDIK
ncbi:hypothetical protein Tco_0641262 [Tanacetum coccineum]